MDNKSSRTVKRNQFILVAIALASIALMVSKYQRLRHHTVVTGPDFRERVAVPTVESSALSEETSKLLERTSTILEDGEPESGRQDYDRVRERTKARLNKPVGAYEDYIGERIGYYEDLLDSGQDTERAEKWIARLNTRLSEYHAMDSAQRAAANYSDLFSRINASRRHAAVDAASESPGAEKLFLEHSPETYLSLEELRVRGASRKLSSNAAQLDRSDWKSIARDLRSRRANSVALLETAEDRQWHEEHINWIDESAMAMGIPLGAKNDTQWIRERIALEDRIVKEQLFAPFQK